MKTFTDTFADIVKNVIGDEIVIWVYYTKKDSEGSSINVTTSWDDFLNTASKISWQDVCLINPGIRFVMVDNSYWEFENHLGGWSFQHHVFIDYKTLPVSKITTVDLF